MKGELWTMSMHQPVDTRELDRLARRIVKQAVVYRTLHMSSLAHSGAHGELLEMVRQYQERIFDMVLEEPTVD